MRKYTVVLACICFVRVATINAQDEGVFSGDLELLTNFFIADEEIGAANIPQYDNQLIGIDAWLNLSYAYKGFEVGMRFDMFTNSNLQNPNASFNGAGIGRWYAHKKVNKLDITAGYIYDQIGAGTIFRAYEQRPLFIDNALRGVRLAYDLSDQWTIKAFGGNMKNPLALSRDSDTKDLTHGASVKGLAIDGYVPLGKVYLAPGLGVVNRTLTKQTVEALQTLASTYIGKDRDQIELQYNTYAMALYNRLSVGRFSLYLEGAYKTESTIFDPYDERTLASGSTSLGQYVNHDGSVIYGSLTYAHKNLGITIEGKRTEHFSFRTDPTLTMVNGMINYLPPMNRENTYRLTARYAPAVQDFGEFAYQVDVRYSPGKKWSINANFSHITDHDDQLLYQEIFTEAVFKQSSKLRWTGGLQLVEYNQRVYEGKPELQENVQTVVPFIEALVKFSRKKSLRIEAQYMHTEQDYGSWIYSLLEYGVAPHWIFTVSDMYNVDPKKTEKDLHYPTAGIVYSYKSSRFSLSYVKQVEGIVCAGGICRLEPAFSGFKLGVNTTF